MEEMEKCSFWRLISLKIRWSPWNPWCLGRMNLAWTKYTETPMYEGRKQLEKDHPVDFKDFAYKSFINNYEIKHFMASFTKKDKIRLLFAPFSFGSAFQMPFQKLEDRIFGFFDKI
jgi:hypothetical protein